MDVLNTERKSKKKTTLSIKSLVDQCTSGEDLEQWHGTLAEYLPMVQEMPSLNDTSHARLWRMVEAAGISFDEKDEGGKEKPEYKFFTRELFGINDTLAGVMQYLKAAAAGSDVSRRILLLYGPTSSGKSQFALLLKEGLEQFSRTKEGRIYGLDGCPMHENPLNAIPKAARAKMKDECDIFIEGELCPRCAWRLENEFAGDFWQLPVKRIFLSEANRVGIGTFQPADPKCCSLDTLVLTSEGPLPIGSLGSEHEQDLNIGVRQSSGGFDRSDKFYIYRNQRVKRITTRLGYSIAVTPNHPLVVGREDGTMVWVEAKDIQKGEDRKSVV